MATEITSLSVKIGADLSGFRRGMRQVQTGVRQTEASFAGLQRAARFAFGALAATGLGALGRSLVTTAADMDSLRRALDAVTGSSDQTAIQMERLKEVARAPGLGFREAVQGSVNLQAVGFAAKDAERALKAFGNAIATTGGGRAELDRVLLQLTQMAATGRIVAQDLRPIVQTAPAVAKALNELFGTTSAEAIAAQVDDFDEFFDLLITKLEQMPSVAGGAKNALENLGDAAFRLRASIGEQLLPVVEPVVNGLADAAEALADNRAGLTRAFTLARDGALALSVVLAGRLAASLTASAAASVRKTQASFAEARAQVAATRATLDGALAQMNMARAMGRTTGALLQQRAAATQLRAAWVAHNAAMAQASVSARLAAGSMGVLRGAFALLGGWPGIIVTALGGLVLWLGRSRREAEETAAAVKMAIAESTASLSELDKAATFRRLGLARKEVHSLEQALADLNAQAERERTERIATTTGAGDVVFTTRGRETAETREAIRSTTRALEVARGEVSALERQYISLAQADIGTREELDLTRGTLALTADNFARLQKAMADARDRLAELQVERAITPAGPALDRVNQSIDGLRERIALLQGEIARFESEGFGLTPRIDIGNSIKDGLRQIDTAEVSRITKDVARVGESIGSGLVATMREQGVMAGEALMRGLLSGANNLGDIIKSSLINLAVSYVMGPFKAALGIASPSKVFADYGRSLGDGLVEGIESRIAAVQRATSRLTSAASMPTMTPALASVGPMAQAPLFDASKLPRPTDPRQAARDADWLHFLSDSIREWEASGGRMGGR